MPINETETQTHPPSPPPPKLYPLSLYYLYHSIMDDLDQSLDGVSQWVYLKKPTETPMEESLVAFSEKIPLANASALNRAELEKAKKQKTVTEELFEDTQNQFLEVGKWRKNKESMISQEMASVKNEVQENMTKTQWKQQQQKIQEKMEEKEEVIADQSICPDEDEKEKEEEEAIEDQTQNELQEQQEEEEEEQEQEEQEEEEQQDEEEEQSEDEEQEQKEEQQQQQKTEPLQQGANLSNPPSSKAEEQDDKTDTQSQMKRTEYLPSKWTKKQDSSTPNNSTFNEWQRKEAILKRILLLVK